MSLGKEVGALSKEEEKEIGVVIFLHTSILSALYIVSNKKRSHNISLLDSLFQ